jgi:hypothetical protein
MWGQSKQATSATIAIIMLTLGALIDVWTVVLYILLQRHDSGHDSFLWCYGLFASGIVLMVVGLAIGRIGRSAIQAETAATPSQIVVPTTTAAAVAPAAASNVQPIVAPVAQIAPQVPPVYAQTPRVVVPSRPV